VELRGPRAAAHAAALLAAAALWAPPPAFGQEQAQSQAVEPSAVLTRPASPTRPPRDHFLNAVQATRIALRDRRVREELPEHEGVTRRTFAKGPGRWQISWYAGGDEIVQAIVDEREGRAVEVWTGHQVAWEMARGREGAFGRRVNSPWVWIPLMLAFFVPFFDPRRPFRLLHLDLLVLLSFSLSHVWFNRGEIGTSVPLVYPVLAYLLVRLLALGRRSSERPAPQAPFVLVPAGVLVLGLVFLVGFRVGLNVTDSNVIDVGYSGVIGADRLTHGEDIYGSFPDDNGSGDTYGPVAYYAYVPFEAAFPWSGTWDDLPAAHAAAVAFDLATLVALFFAGRSLLGRGAAGNRLGLALAYAWAAYPYTAFVLNSNANDSLVALLVTLAFLTLASPRGRGVALALAGAAKLAPLSLALLWSSYDRRRGRDALAFFLALGAATVLLWLPVLPDGGVREAWDRTIGFQLGRDSPFSIWGLEDLGWAQDVMKALAIALAVGVALRPRLKTAVGTAALGAAVLVALQLSLSHWFYLYIVWWLPLALIAVLAAPQPARGRRAARGVADRTAAA